MNTRPVTVKPPEPDFAALIPDTMLGRLLANLRDRIVGGLLLLLPVAITFWILRWGFLILDENVIEPAAAVVIWKTELKTGRELPDWFRYYAAPAIAVVMILAILYLADLLANTTFAKAMGWVMANIPLVSMVYSPVRKVFNALEKPPEAKARQRVVLVQFPHPGMKVPAFVTATCRDTETQKTILCVYVPTTPVPTSGYFLMVPEDEVVDLSWTSEQALEAIISAGLTSPPEVRFSMPGMLGLPPIVTNTGPAFPEAQSKPS